MRGPHTLRRTDRHWRRRRPSAVGPRAGGGLACRVSNQSSIQVSNLVGKYPVARRQSECRTPRTATVEARAADIKISATIASSNHLGTFWTCLSRLHSCPPEIGMPRKPQLLCAQQIVLRLAIGRPVDVGQPSGLHFPAKSALCRAATEATPSLASLHWTPQETRHARSYPD